MERLYSNFANGWTGRGLLLLRVAVFLFLIERAWARAPGGEWLAGAAAVTGLLVLVGMWIRAGSGAAAVVALAHAVRGGEEWTAPLLAAAMAASLMVLGPGAWSVDARRFGRRRIAGSGRG